MPQRPRYFRAVLSPPNTSPISQAIDSGVPAAPRRSYIWSIFRSTLQPSIAFELVLATWQAAQLATFGYFSALNHGCAVSLLLSQLSIPQKGRDVRTCLHVLARATFSCPIGNVEMFLGDRKSRPTWRTQKTMKPINRLLE